MSAVDKLITRIEELAERQAGYQQLDDRRRSRIYELEGQVTSMAAEIETLQKDRDHWRQAQKDAIEAGDLMKAEIEMLRQQLAEAHAPAMAQQSEEIAYLRARLDEERSVSAGLRQQLDESQARRVVVSNEAANDKLQKIAIHCELRAAQAEIASMRQQLAEAQQPDVGAMLAFVGKVRAARDCYEWPQSWHRIEAALAELDAQPAPVAETAEGGT